MQKKTEAKLKKCETKIKTMKANFQVVMNALSAAGFEVPLAQLAGTHILKLFCFVLLVGLRNIFFLIIKNYSIIFCRL